MADMPGMSRALQNERISQMRVLVVDSFGQFRELMRDILLRGIGVGDVIESRDGKEAISILRETPCDVVFADASMEPIGGVELTRQIRAGVDGIDPFLPVIVMSGHANLGEIIEARDTGANDYIAKPLSAKILDLRLHALVARPRPFIRSDNFFGPDRRRHAVDQFKGPNRRIGAPDNSDTEPSGSVL